MLSECQLQISSQEGGLPGQRVTHHSLCFQAPNSLKARNMETGNREADVVYSLGQSASSSLQSRASRAKGGFASPARPTLPRRSQETGPDEDRRRAGGSLWSDGSSTLYAYLSAACERFAASSCSINKGSLHS